jgi:outer membrane protein assembly factor BamD (BamD/ComL family)
LTSRRPRKPFRTRSVLFPLAIVAGLHWAPLQCASDPDPALRRYETPGEALYGLAKRFRAEGDEHAYRATLEYLVKRYPNSRYASMAKSDLAQAAPGKTP